MKFPENIVLDPQVMGEGPFVRGTRVTVGLIVGMLAGNHDRDEVLKLYSNLTLADIRTRLFRACLNTVPWLRCFSPCTVLTVHEVLSLQGDADA